MHGLTEAAESMNCSNCNASNPPGAASCIKCHAPLGADEAQTLDGMPESRATPVTVGVAEPAAASLTVLKPGSVLGARYEILGLLGVGGMGAVYKARDREVDRLVVLKVIRPELAGNPEILQRFKDDWDALERELRKFIDELRLGDRNEFPGLDPKGQVPFVRLVLEECTKNGDLSDARRKAAISASLEIVERVRQEVRKVGFWKNPAMRELLTKALVRDLDGEGICRPGTQRDLAQRLVALAKENHENMIRS